MEEKQFDDLAKVDEIPVRKLKNIRFGRIIILVEIVGRNRNMLRGRV
jgi:hypothetical protein